MIQQKYIVNDYWCWDNFFNKEEIKKFNLQIKKNIVKKEDPKKAASGFENKILKKVNSYIVNLCSIIEFVKPVLESAHYANDKNFQYDLHYNPELHDTGNYNIYSSKNNSEYKWHTDASPDIRYDLKFTVLINLSEKKYTGGNFQIFNQHPYTIEKFKNPGSVLMFKSHLNHCVTPILSGERKTFTMFLHGPKWK
jgi:predicted 2-oxoglutarate/Fe(II)-dependent dioxygenase YbiX